MKDFLYDILDITAPVFISAIIAIAAVVFTIFIIDTMVSNKDVYKCLDGVSYTCYPRDNYCEKTDKKCTRMGDRKWPTR